MRSPITQMNGLTVGFEGSNEKLSEVYSELPEPERAAIRIQ